MHYLKSLGAAAVLAGILSGCGHSTSNPVVTIVPATANGVFVDAPVEGLSYVSGSHKGKTDAAGTFTYEIGQPVTFQVGDIVLGQAPGEPVITPLELVKSVDVTASNSDARVVNIVRFLLSVNGNADATKIIIPDAVTMAAAGKSIDFSNESQLTAVVSQIAPDRNLVNAATALAHFSDNLAALSQQFAGSYILASPDTLLRIVVGPDGTVSGTAKNVFNEESTVTGMVTTPCSFSGTLTGPVTLSLWGNVDLWGNISLNTQNPENGIRSTQTFTGFRTGPVDAKYTGVYTSALNNGTVTLTVNADGTLSGTYVNKNAQTYTVGGAVSSTGTFEALAVGPDTAVINGVLDGTVNLAGIFVELDPMEGSPSNTRFTGVKTSSP